MTRYERIIQQHPEIQSWLENRPLNTQKAFSQRLMDFCKAMKITPEKWRHMDKFDARDLAWKYIKSMVKKKPF